MTRVVITAVGTDRIGIVAGISNAIASVGANIEDLTSSRLGDKFVMLIVCDLGKSSFEGLKRAVTSAGEKLGMSVVVQREEIFRAMHRV
ncbi:MAG: ACT domain-containing protein [Candidatus Hadarchaeales archaeon]